MCWMYIGHKWSNRQLSITGNCVPKVRCGVAVLLHWAAMLMAAAVAVTCASVIIVVAIVIALNAGAPNEKNGYRHGKQNCCPFLIFMSCLHCPIHSINCVYITCKHVYEKPKRQIVPINKFLSVKDIAQYKESLWVILFIKFLASSIVLHTCRSRYLFISLSERIMKICCSSSIASCLRVSLSVAKIGKGVNVPFNLLSNLAC